MDRKQHLKQVNDLIKTFADPCDGIIYHYTSAEGFQGIIESGEIWLKNTEFVNDTTECKVLQEETDIFEEGELSFNRYIEKWWQSFKKDNDKESSNFYIASFSKKPDSLEQWRAYGNICIGFDATLLKKDGFSLYECVYDKSKIKEWMLKKAGAKEWMLNEPDRTRNYIANDGCPTTCYDDGRRVAAFSLIFAASIKLKHFCYKNEEEVRLLAVSSHYVEYPNSPSLYDKEPPIHFQPHPVIGVPVPYVKYFTSTQPEGDCDSSEKYKGKTVPQIKEEKREKEKKQKRALLPIKEIQVGPTPHKEETRLACEILLQEKGYKDVQINVSEIPYRGF